MLRTLDHTFVWTLTSNCGNERHHSGDGHNAPGGQFLIVIFGNLKTYTQQVERSVCVRLCVLVLVHVPEYVCAQAYALPCQHVLPRFEEAAPNAPNSSHQQTLQSTLMNTFRQVVCTCLLCA